MVTLGPVKFEEATHETVPDASGEKGPRIEASRAAYRAYAVCEDQSCMEVVTDGKRPHVFAAIFDGHNGPLCSSFCRKHCYEVLCAKMKKHGRVVDFIRATCEELDSKFMRNHPQFRDYVQGSCLVLAYVDLKARRLYVGNLGDSRAVLGRQEGRHIVSETLTVDHNTATKSERLRVLAEHPGMVDAQLFTADAKGTTRLKGVIQVTRSIGDPAMKYPSVAKRYNKDIEERFQILPLPGTRRCKPYMSNVADVLEYDLKGKELCLILASDGLWDLVPSDHAVVRQEVFHELAPGATAAKGNAAAHLIHYALSKVAERKGRDNRWLNLVDQNERELLNANATLAAAAAALGSETSGAGGGSGPATSASASPQTQEEAAAAAASLRKAARSSRISVADVTNLNTNPYTKKEDQRKSYHDDITVVVLKFRWGAGEAGAEKATALESVSSANSSPSPEEAEAETAKRQRARARWALARKMVVDFPRRLKSTKLMQQFVVQDGVQPSFVGRLSSGSFKNLVLTK